MRAVATALMSAVLCVPLAAAGEPGRTEPGRTEPGGTDPTPLGGPSVTQGDGRASLVERGYDGRVKPLDARAEVAALDKLDWGGPGLDEEARAKVDQRLAAYTGALDAFVVAHIPELMSVESWLKDGQWPRVLMLVDELRRAVGEATGGLRLREAIADALPEAARAEYVRMLDEYDAARLAEARADAERTGEGFEPIAYRVRRRVEQLQVELASAFERVIASGKLFADAYLERARLSPESEGRVRGVFQRFAVALDGKEPTPDQIGALVREILKAVKPEERARALRALDEHREADGAKKKPGE